MHITSRLSDP